MGRATLTETQGGGGGGAGRTCAGSSGAREPAAANANPKLPIGISIPPAQTLKTGSSCEFEPDSFREKFSEGISFPVGNSFEMPEMLGWSQLNGPKMGDDDLKMGQNVSKSL